MQSSFLFQIFATLSKTDLIALRKWVRSPVHNQKDEVVRLSDCLMNHKQHLDTLEKEAVFARVFGKDVPYHALRFNRVLSDLTGVIRAFLAFQEWQAENDGLTANLYALRALRRRELDAEFDRQFDRLDQESVARPFRNAGFYHLRYSLENEKVLKQVVHGRGRPDHIQALHDALGNYFMLETLRWSGMAQSLRTLSGTGADAPFAAMAVEAAARVSSEANPSVVLMYQCLRTLKSDATEDDYIALKRLVAEHAQLFSPAESRDFYMAATNYCIKRHNKGEVAYTREAFELYRAALAQNVLPDNGVLATYAYNNIHALAQLLDERAWAQQFLEDYRALLPPKEQENTYRYNLAIHHFRGGAYDRALELLREVQFSEVFINLDVRRMLLRSYFERGDWLSLASLLDSFSTYLRRQQEIGYHRASYLNLIKFTKKLAKFFGRPGARKAADMIVKIKAETYVAEREWLIGKLQGR
jgi:hypothetical protein